MYTEGQYIDPNKKRQPPVQQNTVQPRTAPQKPSNWMTNVRDNNTPSPIADAANNLAELWQAAKDGYNSKGVFPNYNTFRRDYETFRKKPPSFFKINMPWLLQKYGPGIGKLFKIPRY